MPGALGYGWHDGSRGEYLAQYFLTALGVSVPVIRQEDIGIDFYCALGHEENKRVTFHSPYMVQHGAVSKNFVYGGYRDNHWRSYELDWLFSQELPLFVCTTDQENARFRLYSSSAMWLLRYQFGDKMAQVELCPDAHHDPLKESLCEERVGPVENREGLAYWIPLGNPVVDLTINDLEAETRQRAINALRLAIEIEQINLTFRRLGVHVASWADSVRPNDPDSLKGVGGSVFWNSRPGQNVARQIDALKNIAITLTMNFKAQEANSQLAHLAPVFRLFQNESIPDWIRSGLPQIVIDSLENNEVVKPHAPQSGAVGITLSGMRVSR